MKKLILLLSIAAMASLLAGCGNITGQPEVNNTAGQTEAAVQNTVQEQPTATAEKKVLVVYYSYSGNTQEIANQIHQQVGGDILKIDTVRAYPEVYNDLTKQAKEELESGFKPELQPFDLNIGEYDIIYLGSPNWWATIATPVITFLTGHDLSGKTIVPFITHEGSGLGRSVAHIKELAPNAEVRDGLAVRGRNVKSAQNEVNRWLQQLTLN